MANLIKTQVSQILTSNSTGIGRTDDLPETFNFISDNELEVKSLGVFKVSDAILRAKLIQLLNAETRKTSWEALKKTLEAMESDYLGAFHQTAAEKAAGTTTKKVTVPVNNLLTAEQYLANVIKLAATAEETTQALLELDTQAEKVTDKTTKADLLALIKQYQALFVPEEKRETYKVMVAKEAADLEKWSGLAEAGFTDITRLNGSMVANIEPAVVKEGFAQLKELGYVYLSHDLDIESMKVKVVFKEETKEEPKEEK